jgi:Flp pilus assembly protein TadG
MESASSSQQQRFAMKPSRFLRALGNTDAVAAVEFAFIAPILILMTFAIIQFADVYECLSKIKAVAATASDMVSQETELTNSGKDDIFAAARAVLYPHDGSSAVIVLTSVVDDGKGHAKVVWSEANNGSALDTGSSVTPPAGILQPGGSVIVAQVTYSYSPPAIADFVGPLTFTETYYAVPRLSAQVARVRS